MMTSVWDTTKIDISQWDISNVTSMEILFRDSVGFNSNISQWDVGRVTDMSVMFYNEESFNVDIRYWNLRILNTDSIGEN